MSNLNLFQRTQYFNKLAGILKIPQELYNEMLKWTIKIFCGKTLFKINKMLRQNQENVKKIKEIETAKQSKDFKYFYDWFDCSNVEKIVNYILEKKSFIIALSNLYIYMNKTETKNITHFIKIVIDNVEYPESVINIKNNIDKEKLINYLKDNCHKITRIMNEFDNDPYLDHFTNKHIVELNAIKKICLQYTVEEIEDDLTIMNEFEYKNISLYLNIVFSALNKEIIYAEEDWQGLYSSHILFGEPYSIIHLFIGDFEVSEFQKKLKEISETLRHEIQHFIQRKIQIEKKLNESGGLPKQKSIRNLKKRKYDIHGNEISDKATNQSKTISENKSKRLEHKLRDIEYTTNITDKISELKSVIKKFPEKLHDIFIKYFINQISYEEFENKFLPEFIKMHPKINTRNFHFMNVYPTQYSLLNEGRKYFNFLYEKDKQKWKLSIKDLYKEINV